MKESVHYFIGSLLSLSMLLLYIAGFEGHALTEELAALLLYFVS